jgi:phenol 2-monooxygenase
MVLVRPDQYVSHVLPLDGHEALTEFFAGILIDTAPPARTGPGLVASRASAARA